MNPSTTHPQVGGSMSSTMASTMAWECIYTSPSPFAFLSLPLVCQARDALPSSGIL